MNLMRWLSLLFVAVSCQLSVAQADTLNVPHSSNGWYLSPHGTIRILVLFCELQYDQNPARDPQPNGSDHWPKGQLPKWADELFDPHPSAGYLGRITRYYHESSLGRYTVLGDYIDVMLTLRESEYPTLGNAHSIGALAVKEANKLGALRTRHGLGITDFDLWKRGGQPGMPKKSGPDSPHSYDHVMVIARNSGLTHGQGSVDPGSPGKLFGFESDSQSRFGGMNALPFEILKHEFNHMLLGGNNFHSGGGNAAQFESHTLCVQGGWSLMGGASSSLLSCCAWDRDRLGWRPEGAKHRIEALDQQGLQVNSDLDPIAGDTGVFVLRDFVSTGDALRIRIPFVPQDEHPQWLWVENHRTYSNNGSLTDRFHWEDTNNPCLDKAQPGLFLQMQFAHDNRTGSNIFGGLADYLRPLTANGHFDLMVSDTLRDACPFGGTTVAFRRIGPNPLAGNSELELMVFDRNGDKALDRGEHYVPSVLLPKQGERPDSPRFFGSPDHALRMNGTRAIGMGTNPSTASMLTLSSAGKRETKLATPPDNRTVRLNGIRIELLEERSDGAALVRVSTGHTRLTEHAVWCADSIVLPPLRGREGRSLILSTGKRLLIDRSITPTRMALMAEVGGRRYFAPPTRLTVMHGAKVTLERKSELRLSHGSVVHLLAGSELRAERKSKITIEGRSLLMVHAGARLDVPAKTLKKLKRSGKLIEAD